MQCTVHHSGVYTDCKDALTQGQTTSGVYAIKPDNQSAFQAYCNMDTDGGGWTVFQRREDGSVDFYRNWTDYQQGFGILSGEFWLGLDKIHRLTSTATQLRIDMQDFVMRNMQISVWSIQIHSVSIRIQWNCRRLSYIPQRIQVYHKGPEQ